MREGCIGDTVFLAEGAGPAVVLLHGLGLNRHMWDGQWEALTSRFQVVRYDLMGHGESAKPSGPYRLGQFVAQLAALIDGLELERCALVGFSFGGMIIRAFALAHPARVSALAILNSAHDRTDAERAGVLERVEQAARCGPQATVDAALARWFTADFAARRPEVLDQVRRWVVANDPEVYPHSYRVMAECDAELARPIAAIQCPALVLACDEDRGNSPDMAERMAALMPNGRAAIVPDLRHMGLVEDPEAINAVLVPFLEEVLGPGGA